MDALGEQQAVVAGHDWGAPVAWHTALFRPDRIRGVIGLSVPYRPRGSAPPIPALRAGLGDGFYMVYFQEPGVAEAGLERDLRATFRRVLSSASGTGEPGPGRGGLPIVPPGGEFLDICPEPDALPSWLTDADIDAFAAQYAGRSFSGPLNWYRNLDRNWELTGAWHHAPVLVPALYLAGEQDLVVRFPGAREGIEQLGRVVPAAARAGAAAGLRALDPAGAAGGGQRGHDRLPARAGLSTAVGCRADRPDRVLGGGRPGRPGLVRELPGVSEPGALLGLAPQLGVAAGGLAARRERGHRGALDRHALDQ